MLGSLLRLIAKSSFVKNLQDKSFQEDEIRQLLHGQIVFGVGIGAMITCFCLNPYLVTRPTGAFVTITVLIGIVWAAMGMTRHNHAMRALSIVYIALLCLGFRIQAAHMGDMGYYWIATVSVQIIMGTIFVFNTKTEYFLSSAVVVACMFIGLEDTYFTAVSSVLLCVSIVSAVAVGCFLNHAAMACIREIYDTRERFRVLSNTDTLTGLDNRRAFMDHLNAALASADRRGLHFAMIDIDNFKMVNDKYGHETGDAVLIAFAELLKTTLPAGAAGRLGGEEFGILLEGKTAEEAMAQMRTLLDKVETLQVNDVSFSFSGGLLAVSKGQDASTLLKQADAALYQAKRSGKARIVWALAHTEKQRPKEGELVQGAPLQAGSIQSVSVFNGSVETL